jgi:aspartate kinase
MKVFKFGGASVRSAASVENVGRILARYSNDKLVVVVSAMGKMTNRFEDLLRAWHGGEDTGNILSEIEVYHYDIAKALFPDPTARCFVRMKDLFDEIREMIGQKPSADFNFDYDQLVCFGEVLSTVIVFEYIHSKGFKAEWVDVRNIIKTDNRQREANVDWVKSAKGAEILASHLSEEHVNILVTQGFVGGSALGNTSTLGREGSDYSAAIIAYLANAESVTIWKDVPGMLNADPKWFKNTVKLDRISYREAIELAYYGASVIHPKTIKPLQNKNIPLYVKSFEDPKAPGTVIQESMDYDKLVPSYIFKANQQLVSISPRDFSFIMEENLSEIFATLSEIGIRINLMQNSAINFSICVDQDPEKLERLRTVLAKKYEVKYNTDVELLTIRHNDPNILRQLTLDYQILVEQRTRSTVRMVLRKEKK